MEGVFFPGHRTTGLPGVSYPSRSITATTKRYSSATSAQSSVRRRFTAIRRVPHTGHEAWLVTEIPQYEQRLSMIFQLRVWCCGSGWQAKGELSPLACRLDERQGYGLVGALLSSVAALLNTLPMLFRSTSRMAMSPTATSAMIRAYSTKPWPESSLEKACQNRFIIIPPRPRASPSRRCQARP